MIESFRFSAWRAPEAFLLLLVPLAWELWRWRRGSSKAAMPFGALRLLQGVPQAGAWWGGVVVLLHGLGLVVLLIALARPVDRVELPSSREGLEIMLVLDRSSSMQQSDLDPARSRMQLAVAAAQDFVAAREQDRIGLIAFARYPDLLAPSSLDHEAIRDLLQQIESVERDGPEDLTGIGAAVARAAQVLQPRTAKSKVVVLLTDGEENVATPAEPGSLQPLEAAALCRAFGVQVFAIAMAQGEPGELNALARATGGRAFAAADAQALPSVFARIDALAKSPLADPSFEDRERFLPWMLLGAALVLISRLLRAGPAEVLA